ncbi:MAG: KaiC domain-containing protein [Firmicutes bacterium]|nr:KaiC domain-containing protein [Bacillota bacterium]
MSQRKGEIIEEGVISLAEAGKRAPKLYGVESGVEGLDNLFYVTNVVDGKPVKVPLGGYPAYSVVNLTGVADTGKTLMVEQFAVKQASLGNNIGFLTVETPGPFVAYALKIRANAMGVPYDLIEDKIIIIDAASYTRLREDLMTLFNTLAYAIKEYSINHFVIDAITGFFEEQEMLARGIVRRFFNFMKKWYQTAIFVSQKRSGHELLTAEAAGGFAVSHIVDCSIVLAKIIIENRNQERLYRAPIGETVRLFRIDGCRLCGHDTSTHIMEILETGLVRIGPSLREIAARS